MINMLNIQCCFWQKKQEEPRLFWILMKWWPVWCHTLVNILSRPGILGEKKFWRRQTRSLTALTISVSWALRCPAVSSLRSALCFSARVAFFSASLSTSARCFSSRIWACTCSSSACCWPAARSRFWPIIGGKKTVTVCYWCWLRSLFYFSAKSCKRKKKKPVKITIKYDSSQYCTAGKISFIIWTSQFIPPLLLYSFLFLNFPILHIYVPISIIINIIITVIIITTKIIILKIWRIKQYIFLFFFFYSLRRKELQNNSK